MSIRKRSLMLFFLVVSTSLILSSCSNNTTSSDSDTGSIAFTIEWPSDVSRMAQALNDPDIDCDVLGIASIDIGVYEATGVLIKDESFECSIGEGTIDNISSGSNRSVYVFGKDASGNILYLGEEEGVSISPGVITDVGTLELEEVDPEADSDGDGVNDDKDLCPSTPSGVTVNINGCPDSDGDGVYDDQDICSNTPSGDQVDVNGCTTSSRFTDIGDGTVRDNNTGLLWLKNANCFGSMTWQNASTAVDALNSGECGLTDGSASGDWRLPTINEWDSFIDDSYEDPSLSNAAGSGKWVEGDSFNEVISWYYWSATEYDVDNAYIKSMYDGITLAMSKTDVNDVWPVRDEN